MLPWLLKAARALYFLPLSPIVTWLCSLSEENNTYTVIPTWGSVVEQPSGQNWGTLPIYFFFGVPFKKTRVPHLSVLKTCIWPLNLRPLTGFWWTIFFSAYSVISGVGELDVDKGLVKKEEPSGKDRPYPDCPFLLLDVRDRDSYQQCHIVGGKREGAPKSQKQSLASFREVWS